MVTYDDLLLPIQLCNRFDLFFSRDNQSAEFLIGTFPEISSIFETNWKHIFTSKSHMTIKLASIVTYDDLLLPTHSCDLLIFWACDKQSAEFLKGTFKISSIFETNWKRYIFTSKSCMTIKLGRVVTYGNFLLLTQSCNLLIFWSRDNQRAEFFKGTFPEIWICLKLIETYIFIWSCID